MPPKFPPKSCIDGTTRATPPQPGVSRGKNQKTKRNGKTDRGANTKQNFEVMSRVDEQIDIEARCLSPCCMFPCLASCCHQHQHHHHLISINITLPTLNCLFQSLHSISSAQYQPLFDPIPFQMVGYPSTHGPKNTAFARCSSANVGPPAVLSDLVPNGQSSDWHLQFPSFSLRAFRDTTFTKKGSEFSWENRMG